jgi:hypothetical protein
MTSLLKISGIALEYNDNAANVTTVAVYLKFG